MAGPKLYFLLHRSGLKKHRARLLAGDDSAGVWWHASHHEGSITMKKLAFLSAVAAMSLALAACGKSHDADNAALGNDATLNDADFTTDQNGTADETANQADAVGGIGNAAAGEDAPAVNGTAANAR